MKEGLGEELIQETEKWLKKIENKIDELSDKSDSNFVNNIKAYIHDSKYFMKKGDLIRAFECVVWAWAWLEIGELTNRIHFSKKK
jgi:hypothetical protein